MEDDVPVPETSYHVFINQRGADVNKTLGSLLYRELTGFGLRVFISDNEHRSGDTVLPATLSAIGSASVHISIFSERYAESRSCLNELCWILKSATFIPLFYNVEPLDLLDIVERQNGSVTMVAVERWKRALSEASQISEHIFNRSESDHGEFLERIVEIVLEKVEWRQLQVARDPDIESSSVREDAVIKAPELSYKALSRVEKETFLEIGNFFVGEETELAIRVLEGLDCVEARGYLQSLRQKCLITFETKQSDPETECRTRDPEDKRYGYYYRLPPNRSYEIVTMRDQIREFSRNIGKEEFRYPLRVSCSNEIQKIVELQDGEECCWIRGIRTATGEGFPDYPNYIRGVGLRLLVVEYPHQKFSSFLEKCHMSGDLVWLRFQLSNFNSIHLPSTLSLQTLRVLELKAIGGDQSDVEGLESFFHHHVDEPVSDLTELNIELSEGDPTLSSKERWSFLDNPMRFSARDIPEQAPECIGRFVEWIGTSMIHLQKIVLKNIKFLQTLPANLGNLANLRHLDLSGCTNLNELPNSFSQLLRLQFLSLQDCMYLSIPEDILGQISTLEHVDFQGCSKLADLPEGIPQQESLRYLNVLSTPLMQLPDNLGLLENLEQLRIGSPELTELPSSLSNLSSLTELILMSCYQVKHVPWEDVVWPNIKVLGIYTMEVQNLPFTGWMGYLTDLTVKETWISEICIPETVCPRLKNVDLSDNCMLTTIDNLPSTVENLQLQNCSKLQRLTNLSNLAQLKFLDISKCSELQTLNVEGMESLKEIKAVECWKLQRVNGLYQRRKRLNCLQISTENGVLWNAIWKFLTSPSEISTVILSTRAADDTVCVFSDTQYNELKINNLHDLLDFVQNDEEKAMRSIVSNFENIEALDKFPAETKGGGFYKILENVHSYGAVFMCFITDGPGSSFGVTFVTEKTIGRRYVTMRNGGRCLHVFFWTEDSGGLRDYDIVVSWEPDSSESVGKQWIVMLRDKTEVFELCNRVLSALAPEGFHLHTSE